MKKRVFLNLLICILTVFTVSATRHDNPSEKIPLSHDVYEKWKNITRQQISPDGRWVSWEANPQQGDGWLYIKDLQTNHLDSVARGTRAVFSPNSDFMAFHVDPPTAVIRQAKVDGKSSDEMPGDSVVIYVFANSSNRSAGKAGSFALAEKESGWMVYLLKEKASAGAGSGNLQSETYNKQLPGTMMYIFNPITGQEHRFPNVVEYNLSANGALVGFIQNNNRTGQTATVRAFNTETQTVLTILDAPGEAKGISICDDGKQITFFYTTDIIRDTEIYNLYHWDDETERVTRIIYPELDSMPEGWSINTNFKPRFSKDGSRLFFGTAPGPDPAPADTLLEEERYKVDIWHYQDPLIQPQQLAEADQEARRSYPAVLHIERAIMVQLATPQMPDVTTIQKGDGRFELGTSTLPYQIQNSFESGEYRDVYLVDVTTGERRLLLEKHRGSVHLSTQGDARLSPEGKYLIWYSQADSNWHVMSTKGDNTSNITASIPYPLYNELHDTPSLPGPYGIAGWVEDDSYVLIYDRYDIWKIDPSGEEEPVSLTNGYGRTNNIRFRYVDPADEDDYIGQRENIMLSAFNNQNKQSGFYHVRVHRPREPSQRVMDDVRYYNPQKARDANVIIWQKSTFSDYPDLWVSNTRFRNPEKISNINPRQDKYKWGTAQLVEWVSFNNDSLQGLLYLPENIDPGKKYPMIVYFYERLSDNLHRHYVPAPSRSTINISWCVSNDYIVFVPDIPYTIGYPGQSAYDAIVSGTRAMINKFDFIDRDNTGIQGQSWAGYQIAYLLTQTDMFKAAMAGAPVSNMISAYGGIRWSTGLSRIYQYEETQSRIGGTIWDQTLRYIENSPLFFADKVNTPLLMMHNDADGAVPWYQGIEFFMALRRLGSPVWMLNYNGEAHNLTRWPNRMDLSIRMYQFFDHYLKGKPAPVWLKEGIPAIRKGRKDGYEPHVPSGNRQQDHLP